MKQSIFKRVSIGAMLALGMASMVLTALPTGQADAASPRDNCYFVTSANMCSTE